ncbi:ABC transporter substrate-binding protein [Tengunoibacter tsumagoiensis]|uniref:Sugar ABC transporter substrate-binding protein n=1 Tax=Tengunoibacter tsumagoiensis TaxID=2014871 RepID=A0A401ZZB1_9CHLR|nr:sugar ABC transporter substrate-binding protein [Tengunoibacter tsumagoiensis]GCE12173.1 sugar ABC transporter substrate-binding protein [Tengunoibacter tsumagoiensis]
MQYVSKSLPKLSRTALLTVLSTLLVLLAACGNDTSSNTSSSSSGVVNLTYWSWIPNLQTSIDLFNKTHPNIHVNWETVPSGSSGTYAKMFTALKAGNAPDLGQVEYQFLPTFEATGGLVDLSPYGASSVKDKFVPWTWGQVTQGNAIYAIPQDTGPMVMYYRADLFEKYNIPVPTTWDEYAAAAQTLHKADPNIFITDFPPKESGQYIGYVWQAGGRMFNIDGQNWKVGINDPASKKVANYWQGLLDKNLVTTDPDFAQGWYNDLQTGRNATWISATWGANTILSNAASTSGKWKVAPMPQWSAGQNVAGNWGGSTTAVFKDSKHPKEAAEFAQWLNTDAQSVTNMVNGAQLYPALSSALDTPASSDTAKFYSGQNINEVFKAASNSVDVKFQWGPTMSDVFTSMGDSFTNAINGKGTLSSALDDVQKSTVDSMKKQGFSVSQ